ncbi:MAG TPA: ribonuclease P protein component [Candidatus Dormibacteraeota bacterium]|nr:ribonuclease P protein component [Candidatus Dormibacteraeota bacterium]
MLDRKHRFHGLGSLNYVYRGGQTVRSSQISLKYIANPRRQTYRLAVVVSRKVHKSAVDRNRVRRRLFEVVRKLNPDNNAPYDLVLTVFSDQLIKLSHLELEQIVRQLLSQAGLIMGSKSSGHAIVET